VETSRAPESPAIPHLDTLVRGLHRSDRSLTLVRSLCDEVGPRYPCTPGDVAAVAWAKERLRQAGLSNVRSEAAPAELWERGAESCELLMPRRQPVVLTALGGSVGTDPAGLEAEVLAFGSLDELEATPTEKIAGRVVYLHHVMPRLRDGTGYNGGSVVRTRGPSAAAKKGAIACLVRSVGTDSMRAAHTGALFYEPGVTQIPSAALSIPDADLLHRHLSSGKPAHVRLSLGCRPLPVGESANVIGELPGTDRAEEIVLFGAHLDSWDLGTGALDDGAGCAIAISVLAAMAALPVRPRRTIRVALFANEELGTGGGIAYARTHADEASRHVIAMEADQGDGAPWALRVPEGARQSALTQALLGHLSPLGIELDAGPSRGGVDIGPLRQLGVPFADLRQDATRYFDFHHTVNDVFENVSRDDLSAATTAFAVALWVFANAEGRFEGPVPTP
jgi:hypothetical protein